MKQDGTWYLATCHDCDPVHPLPFRVEAERDAWARAHFLGTEHSVNRSMIAYREVPQ